MAVVNSDILRIIAFNDYKHDSKPKHGVRGASPEDVKLVKFLATVLALMFGLQAVKEESVIPPVPSINIH